MTTKTEDTALARPTIIRRKERSYVPIKFTQDQLTEITKDLNELLKERFDAETQITKSKARLKEIQQELNGISEKISKGGHSQNVECDIEIDLEKKEKRYYYNGELLESETEQLDDYEIQTEINDEFGESEEEEEAKDEESE